MAYLTVPEYVGRYGERETILLTNDEAPIGGGTATYDAAKVEGAVDDATEEVEGYIGRRYATPLASPPRIVKGWVASIARLKLAETTGRVSEAIKEAADRTYTQLAQLVASKLDLPVDENTTAPAPIGTGAARSSGDRATPVFGSTLDSFTAPFTGGGAYAPCWRGGR